MSTLEQKIEAATDDAERSRLAIEATVTMLRDINVELRQLDREFWHPLKPAEQRQKLERFAELEASKAELLDVIRGWGNA